LLPKGEVLPHGTYAPVVVEWGRRRAKALRDLVEAGLAPVCPAREKQTANARTPETAASSVLRHLPNMLTASRILLAPMVAILLVRAHGRADWPTGLLFGACALTDQFDGVLARRWQTESAFGMVIDPLADKLLIGTAIGCLALEHRLPWIALVLPLARHVLFWAARFLDPRRGMILPGWTGKISAWLLYPAVGLMIVTDQNESWVLWLFWTGMALIFVDLIRYVCQVPAARVVRVIPRQVINLRQRTGTGHG